MTAEEFARLASVIHQPLVLVAATGEVLAANPAAAELCPALVPGRWFGDALAEGSDAAELLRAWSQHGSPVPTRLSVTSAEGPVEVRAKAMRVTTDEGPAVLVHASSEHHAPLGQLTDRMQQLQREVRYRIDAEQQRAEALAAEQAARSQLERIQKLSAALAAALDVNAVIGAILAHAPEAAGADGVVVAALRGDALALSANNAAAAVGVPDQALPAASTHPLATAAFEGQAQFFSSTDEVASQLSRPATAAGETAGYLAAALPLAHSPQDPPLGALGLVTTRARRLTADERASAALVASLCAQAWGRAQLYERERRLAETLQYALLPQSLPTVPGWGLAVSYVPAAKHAAVGGDWYEIVPLSDSRVGVVVGDVAGHGPAAATAMAQMRSALPAFATNHPDPGQALSAFNDYVCTQLPDEMATVAYLVIDRHAGLLHYAIAGHLPPLLRQGQGHRFLQAEPSPPVGVTPGERYQTTTVALEGRVRVVCYTDGLVERRDEPIDMGLRRLELAATAEDTDADALCASLTHRLVGDDDLDDDMVVLVADTIRAVGSSTSEHEAEHPITTAPDAAPSTERRVEEGSTAVSRQPRHPHAA